MGCSLQAQLRQHIENGHNQSDDDDGDGADDGDGDHDEGDDDDDGDDDNVFTMVCLANIELMVLHPICDPANLMRQI